MLASLRDEEIQSFSDKKNEETARRAKDKYWDISCTEFDNFFKSEGKEDWCNNPEQFDDEMGMDYVSELKAIQFENFKALVDEMVEERHEQK